jgi:hypothetical protein
LVVTTFEKSKKTDSVTEMFVVPSVLDRRDPPYDPAISPRNEERPLGFLIKRVTPPIETVPHHHT